MRLPVLAGTIRRRILANFRADPGVVARLLPAPLEPKLANGSAVVGVCLIRLEEIRPRLLPAAIGLTSENAAHRIAVTWRENGEAREGVYIPRRDTDSVMNHLAGGRLFPGEHHRAAFVVKDDGTAVDVAMRAKDDSVRIHVRGSSTATFRSTLFGSLAEASDFFRRGSVGYSARADGRCLDGIALHTNAWNVSPLAVDSISSSYFEDASMFPEGSAIFDFALLMRDIPHEWHSEPEFALT